MHKLSSLPILLGLIVLTVAGCEDDILLPDLDQVAAPSELGLDFSITGDNSGTVTVRPGGQGVTAFTIDFGDGSSTSASLGAGESATHVYDEGTYTVVLEAMNINGATTTYSEELTVSFRAPENLAVTVNPIAGDPLGIEVSAAADFETNFLVDFGEDPDADPVSIQEGETASHSYASVGTYQVIVRALSGGAASVSDTVTVDISNPILLPVDFEDATKNYNVIGFGRGTAEVIDNPAPDDVNGSNRVVRFNKAEGSEVWAGSVFELGEPIDFGTFQKFQLDVWTPAAGTSVLLKLENAADADVFVEVAATTTTAGGWESLTFDFSETDLSRDYSKVVVFFDFGTPGAGQDYYYDNLRQSSGGPQLELPLTFENPNLTYEWIGFGRADAGIVDNPQSGGINPSSRVGQLTKTDGSEVWAGASLQLPAPVDFSRGSQFSVLVWSPRADVPVLFKLENNDDPNVFAEKLATTTVAGEWETLTFDLGDQNLDRDYAKVVLFFDFGTAGDGSTYYFDDIRHDDGTEVLELPLTFESTTLPYSFENFGGATSEVISNPVAGGINNSARVGQLTKSATAEVWGGSFLTLSEPIDWSGPQTVAIKVYTPAAGTVVRLKLENATDPNVFVELDATTTTGGEWEELRWDFSGQDLSRDYSKVVIFFDFGTAGDGSNDTQYYFDDIRLTN
jgi:hypothetical protein